ncbi:Kinase, NEK [Giardia duodenalis ATCC 50581]|uniref:non-specific serine/threonine protein kinase n=1 Tax=Giardia intestinalis (strain ATCC 50581 / GS clone H7) TaxID=598745 RepID=C6M0A1_GIAIB|nr:Kinase, NEK [Giardia intestinalis ATCC 50581]
MSDIEHDSSETYSLDSLLKDIGHPIGEGSYGTVYSLKSSPHKVVKETPIRGLRPSALTALEIESRVLPRMEHPNIVKYEAIKRTDQFFFIVMKYYPKSLDQLIRTAIRSNESLSTEKIFMIVNQLASGLAYLHNPDKMDSTGQPLPAIIHRDLKPTNILINNEETEIAIADFGLCIEGVSNINMSSIATPCYSSPEALISKTYVTATDMWSVGVIIYEMATGRRPDFLAGRCPDKVFTKGWKAPLSNIQNPDLRLVLEHLLVLDPLERLTAEELFQMTCFDRRTHILSVLKIRELQDAISHDLASTKSVIGTSMLDEGGSLPFTGETPLMDSIRRGDIDELRKLVENSQRFGARNASGMTALMIAAECGNLDAVRLLLPLEANKRCNCGRTALMYAAKNSQLETARELMTVEVGKRNKSGKTALMLATEEGAVELVALLAKYECNLRNASGLTALMIAVKKRITEAVEILAEYEKGVTDKAGKTALSYAIKLRQEPAIEILSRYPEEHVSASSKQNT